MRKVIMGVGTVLVVVGLIQLILSVALIGPVRARLPDIDKSVEGAAGMLIEVADSLDSGAAFLEDLDPRLVEVEETIGTTIDDTVGQLGDLDTNLAKAEGKVPDGIDGVVRFLADLDTVLAAVEKEMGILDDSVRYLGALDTALAEVDGVAATTIEDTLNFLSELGGTLAAVDETVTEINDSVIFTRDSITERLEQVVVGIWPEHLIGWADWIVDTIAPLGIELKLGYLRDLAHFIDPGWTLFPLEVSADELDRLAELVEDTELAAWIRDWAAYLRREGLELSLTPEDIAGAFTPAIENLDLVSDTLAHTSDYMRELQTSLGGVKQLTEYNISETRELLMTARTSLEAAKGPILDGLSGSREALQATKTSVGDARGPTIEGIASTRKLLGTAKTSLGDIKTPVLGGISETREFLKMAQTDLGVVGGNLRVISEDIVRVDPAGMLGGLIGWLQTYMIITSILFMAAGAGLFLVGMKKPESPKNLTSKASKA